MSSKPEKVGKEVENVIQNIMKSIKDIEIKKKTPEEVVKENVKDYWKFVNVFKIGNKENRYREEDETWNFSNKFRKLIRKEKRPEINIKEKQKYERFKQAKK